MDCSLLVFLDCFLSFMHHWYNKSQPLFVFIFCVFNCVQIRPVEISIYLFEVLWLR